jgi:hypothetical protein
VKGKRGLWLLAVALVAMGCSGGHESQPRPVVTAPALEATPRPSVTAPAHEATLDVPPASPIDPYRVWIIGDSVISDASAGVQAALQATGEVSVVANTAFPGWGLTRINNFISSAQRTIATRHPQIVLGTWSWDDQAAEADPSKYLQELEAAMRVLLAPGNGVSAVVLIQFPQTGPVTALSNPVARLAAWTEQTEAQDSWDDVASQATAAFPGHALYLTTDQLFAPGGYFYTWFQTPAGTWIRARKKDNTHFCPYGAAQWGALTTNELTKDLKLPPMKPGWELGDWIHDPNYNQPAGACPDDQPPPGYHGIAVPHVAASD